MANDVNTIKIGGVTYSKNEVQSSKTEKKDHANSKGVWEQYNEYNVKLKDGTTIKYKEQSEARQAAVDIQEDGSVNFFGLERATIADNKGKDDVYRLMGCESSRVRMQDNSSFFKDKDKLNFFNRELPNGDMQHTNNNTVDYNKGDFVNDDYKNRDSNPKVREHYKY